MVSCQSTVLDTSSQRSVCVNYTQERTSYCANHFAFLGLVPFLFPQGESEILTILLMALTLSVSYSGHTILPTSTIFLHLSDSTFCLQPPSSPMGGRSYVPFAYPSDQFLRSPTLPLHFCCPFTLLRTGRTLTCC